MEYLKNPIIISIIVMILVFLYLYWDRERKYNQNPQEEKGSINYFILFIAGALTWFILSFFMNDSPSSNIDMKINEPIIKIMPITKTNLLPNTNKFNLNGNNEIFLPNNMSIDGNNKIYHLIGKNNIKFPQPDVFIDIAKF